MNHIKQTAHPELVEGRMTGKLIFFALLLSTTTYQTSLGMDNEDENLTCKDGSCRILSEEETKEFKAQLSVMITDFKTMQAGVDEKQKEISQLKDKAVSASKKLEKTYDKKYLKRVNRIYTKIIALQEKAIDFVDNYEMWGIATWLQALTVQELKADLENSNKQLLRIKKIKKMLKKVKKAECEGMVEIVKKPYDLSDFEYPEKG